MKVKDTAKKSTYFLYFKKIVLTTIDRPIQCKTPKNTIFSGMKIKEPIVKHIPKQNIFGPLTTRFL